MSLIPHIGLILKVIKLFLDMVSVDVLACFLETIRNAMSGNAV